MLEWIKPDPLARRTTLSEKKRDPVHYQMLMREHCSGDIKDVVCRRGTLGRVVSIYTYFEIGPLKERQFTGISHVASEFAASMLKEDPCYHFFFYGQTIVDREIVAELLRRRDGEFLDWHVSRRVGRPAPFAADGVHVGIFPNRKTARRAFDFEVQIIHDLSTLLTPQFHHRDTIAYHALSLERDVASNDLTVCVSDATRDDVICYIPPADPTSVITIHNAASPASKAKTDHRDGDSGDLPCIVVLGTIEPRKNVSQVLEMLRDSPSFADRHRFVFLGRYGWGRTVEDLVAEYGLQSRLDRGSIVFPGFVDETQKSVLLADAHLLIYPSLFEGFGLPVVEAMSFGVPCITTSSSSMPEVGGTACFYFDPFKKGDLKAVFLDALLAIERDGEALEDRCRAQAATFSWAASYDKLRSEILRRVGH